MLRARLQHLHHRNVWVGGEGKVSSEAGRCRLQGSRAHITVRPPVQYPHPGPLPKGEGDLHQPLSLNAYGPSPLGRGGDNRSCLRITAAKLRRRASCVPCARLVPLIGANRERMQASQKTPSAVQLPHRPLAGNAALDVADCSKRLGLTRHGSGAAQFAVRRAKRGGSRISLEASRRQRDCPTEAPIRPDAPLE